MLEPCRFKITIFFLLGFFFSTIPSSRKAINARKPNIVLMIGDDYGYPYYGFMGCRNVHTPNLDSLARGGTVYRYGYSTSSVCAPSLMSLLTGLYPYQWDHVIAKSLNKNVKDLHGEEKYTQGIELMKEFDTLPRYLSKQGYASFQGGKHWEGTYDTVGFTEGMTKDKGEKAVARHGTLLTMAGADGLTLGRETMQPVYDFIDKHEKEPFFIWFAPMLPHSPFDPPEKYLSLYENSGFSDSAKKYYANCTRFDDSAGQLIQYLEKKGLRENTLVIYFSDNGWEQEPHEEFKGNFVTSAIGERLGKGSLHEMGCRTPIILNWPGNIPGGKTSDQLVSTVDVFSTILDYAGSGIPQNRSGIALKSPGELKTRDFIIGSISDVRGIEGVEKPKDGLFLRDVSAWYLASRKWHYIWYESFNREELYEKEKDPEEKTNVLSLHPGLAKSFKQEIENWKQDMIKPFENPVFGKK